MVLRVRECKIREINRRKEQTLQVLNEKKRGFSCNYLKSSERLFKKKKQRYQYDIDFRKKTNGNNGY